MYFWHELQYYQRDVFCYLITQHVVNININVKCTLGHINTLWVMASDVMINPCGIYIGE